MNKSVREQLAQKIEALQGIVFCGDTKEREMLPKSVVLTIIRNAPLAYRERSTK